MKKCVPAAVVRFPRRVLPATGWFHAQPAFGTAAVAFIVSRLGLVMIRMRQTPAMGRRLPIKAEKQNPAGPPAGKAFTLWPDRKRGPEVAA